MATSSVLGLGFEEVIEMGNENKMKTKLQREKKKRKKEKKEKKTLEERVRKKRQTIERGRR